MKTRPVRKHSMVFLLAVNLLLIVGIVWHFTAYLRDNQRQLYEQNLSDIRNVNQASAAIASELYASQERKLANLQRYLSLHEMTLPQLLTYLDESNADANAEFQLISSDYSGYLARKDEKGEYPVISYQHKDYQTLQHIFDMADGKDSSISFTVEFTDQHTGQRSFARCLYVRTREETGEWHSYTLLSVYTSSRFIDHINIDSGFEELSTVLINQDGSYALRNTEFKSEDFFRYLYNYNGLTMDEMMALQKQMLGSDNGTLRYLNSAGEECVYVYALAKGTPWYAVSCVPLRSFHSANTDMRFTILLVLLLTAIMVIDLSYLAALNKRFKASAKEANAASEAKTDFLSRMSHDIRTPLNVINGMTELALSEGDPALINEYLGNIQASGRFLLGLVNDVLDMNKVESGKMELHPKPYAHDEFMTYIRAVILPLCAEKDITFTIQGNLENLTLMVDPLRLNQIFFNLLSNAIKFTPHGGHVSLVGNSTPLTDDRVSLDLEIRDDGIGMSKEFQANMYGSFTREERADVQPTVGTGLGLAIVKNLVDLMGGTIRVESEIGQGTAFFIHLELPKVDMAAQTVQHSGHAVDLSGKHILLCEDHPLNAKIMERLLDKKHILVDLAVNGLEGVEKFEQSPKEYYDAVLMDVRMPIMNGIDAAKAIRAFERPDAMTVPIIALTANAYDTDVKNCLDAGMNAHLAKPVDTQRLYDTLSESIAQREDRL